MVMSCAVLVFFPATASCTSPCLSPLQSCLVLLGLQSYTNASMVVVYLFCSIFAATPVCFSQLPAGSNVAVFVCQSVRAAAITVNQEHVVVRDVVCSNLCFDHLVACAVC